MPKLDYSPLLPIPPLALRKCKDPAVYIRADGEDSFNGLGEDAFLKIVKGKSTRVLSSNVSHLGSIHEIVKDMFEAEAGDFNYDLRKKFNLPPETDPFEDYVHEAVRTGATKLQLVWFWAIIGNPDGGIYLPFRVKSRSPRAHRPYPVFGCCNVNKNVSLTEEEGERLEAMYDDGDEYEATDEARNLLFLKAGIKKIIEVDEGLPSPEAIRTKIEKWVNTKY